VGKQEKLGILGYFLFRKINFFSLFGLFSLFRLFNIFGTRVLATPTAILSVTMPE
jgi:hypothetical protein